MGLSVKEMTGVPGKVILTVTVVMQLINLLLSSASIVSRVILLEAVLEIPLLSEICELGTQAIFFLKYFCLFSFILSFKKYGTDPVADTAKLYPTQIKSMLYVIEKKLEPSKLCTK